MITIFAAWCTLSLLVLGFGFLALRFTAALAGRPAPASRRIGDIFWIGIAALLAVAQLASLALPLDFPLLMGLCAIATLGLAAGWRRPDNPIALLGASLRRYWKRWCIGLILFLPLVVVAAARLANTGPTPSYDTPLYHYSWVRWANTFPAVPGLALLHCRLAGSSGYLLLAALIDNQWWDRGSAWVMPGFFPLAAIGQWIAFLLSTRGPRRLPLRLFCLLTTPFLLGKIGGLAPSLDNDAATNVLLCVLVAMVLQYAPLLVAPFRPRWTGGRFAHAPWLTVVGVASAGFGLKPSGGMAFAYVMAIAVAATLLGLRCRRRSGWATTRSLAALVALPSFLVLGFFGRNLVESGWLLYPAPWGRVSTPWTAPAEPIDDGHNSQIQSVRGQYRVIRAWARLPGPDYLRAMGDDYAAWMPHWWAEFRKKPVYPLVPLGAAAWVLLLAGGFFRRGYSGFRHAPLEFVIGLGILLNLLFWFSSAPDVRFAEGSFWVFFAFPASVALAFRVFAWRGIRVALLAICALLGFSTARRSWPAEPPSLLEIGRAASHPMRLHRFPPERSGNFDLHVPAGGDQCGDAPLPCTPYLVGNLKLRDPGDLGAGFFLDSAEAADPRR